MATDSPMIPAPAITTSQVCTGRFYLFALPVRLEQKKQFRLGVPARAGRRLGALLNGFRITHEFRKDDQSFGRWTDVVDRITGNQGKACIGCFFEYRQIVRRHYFLAGYLKSEGVTVSEYLNLVAIVELINVSKESVAMSGDD